MQHHFIINPAAGQGAAAAYIPKIHGFFRKEPGDYVIYTTKGVGDVTQYVRTIASQTTKPLRFYACGGDGTLGEVINGAVGFNHVSVGVIPSGTGNDFVRSFENPNFFRHIYAQVHGSEVPVDLIKVNDHYAINMLNIGFDCNVADCAARLKKKPLIKGPLAYIAGVVHQLCHKLGFHMQLQFSETDALSGEFLLCTIANGRFCGGGFQSSPHALVHDGLLDVAVIRKLPRLRFLSLLPSYRSGRYLDKQIATGLVAYRQCQSLQIVAATPLRVSVDGEIFSFTTLNISLCEKALNVIVPAGSFMPLLSR